MAEVIPFKGLRYNSEKISSYENVIAPPYDVINKKMQDELYENDLFNIVRLIHNRSEGEARYSEAAKSFRDWRDEEVLVEDEAESIYVYEQDFELAGKMLKRKGFIAGLKLQPLGEGLIYPHERTMSKPLEDRLKLLRATKANLSPIFTLYIDDGTKIKKILDEATEQDPVISTKDSLGVTQKLWLVQDEEQIRTIQANMKGKELFIADGHHRYETSLMYSNETGSFNGSQTTDYTMAMFINMDDEGVVIKPTHRIVQIGKVSFDELEKDLESDFSFTPCKDLDEVMAMLHKNKEKVVFGLSDGNEFMFLTYKGEPEFDLIVLHRELKRYLDIKYSTVQDKIEFSADARGALDEVKNDEHKVVFFVNPTPINTVKEMARAHEIMPQKSTYFYPKLTDGLVVRKLD